MLTPARVVPLLLQRAFITPQAVIDGDVTVLDASRRNRNVKVVNAHGPSYLVKEAAGQDGLGTVLYEAAVYRFLGSFAPRRGFDQYLPRCYGEDRHEGLLFLELLPDAVDLRQHQVRCGRFSSALAARLGRALGRLHLPLTATEAEEATRLGLTSTRPTILEMHRPPLALLQSVSAANIQLIKVIQQFPDFCALLDEVREWWHPGTLVHGDLRWDNCLVVKRTPPSKAQLKLVDWEFTRIGDPDWDIGCVFADYLAFWVLSFPSIPGMPPELSVDLARVPLAKLQPALGSFWQSYIQARGIDTDRASERLLRGVVYTAVRLVEVACEQLHAATELTTAAVALLQMSLNMLTHPTAAAKQLLGIPSVEPSSA